MGGPAWAPEEPASGEDTAGPEPELAAVAPLAERQCPREALREGTSASGA